MADHLPIQADDSNHYDSDDADNEDCDAATLYLDGVVAVTNPQVVTVAKAKAGVRAKKYTKIEDFLICSAWIAASEDSERGAYQKGNHFRATMHKIYVSSLSEQENIEEYRYERYNNGFVLPPQGSGSNEKPKVFSERTASAIHEQFKKVSHKVSKMYGVEKSTLRPSGYDDGKYKALVDYNYNKRFKAVLGDASEIRRCYNYLKEKQKWKSFNDAQEASNNKHTRPLGKKKEKKMTAEKTAVASALKEYRESDKQQPIAAVRNKQEGKE